MNVGVVAALPPWPRILQEDIIISIESILEVCFCVALRASSMNASHCAAWRLRKGAWRWGFSEGARGVEVPFAGESKPTQKPNYARQKWWDFWFQNLKVRSTLEVTAYTTWLEKSVVTPSNRMLSWSLKFAHRSFKISWAWYSDYALRKGSPNTVM